MFEYFFLSCVLLENPVEIELMDLVFEVKGDSMIQNLQALFGKLRSEWPSTHVDFDVFFMVLFVNGGRGRCSLLHC